MTLAALFNADDRCSSRLTANFIRNVIRPCEVNLKALESKFFNTCWSRLRSVFMLRAELRIHLDVERQMFGFGDVAEAALDRVANTRKCDFFRLHCHSAGFDLREVENIADQI